MAQHDYSLSRPCKELEEDLVLFHYGELQDAGLNAVQKHIGSCPNCVAYLKELRTLLPLTVKADDPPQTFWSDYSRELRHKIASAGEKKPWSQTLAAFFQPRLLPIFGAAAVIALALTFTLGKGIWQTHDIPREEQTLMEELPVAENLEFYNTMDVLDNLDLLEFMSSEGGAA